MKLLFLSFHAIFSIFAHLYSDCSKNGATCGSDHEVTQTECGLSDWNLENVLNAFRAVHLAIPNTWPPSLNRSSSGLAENQQCLSSSLKLSASTHLSVYAADRNNDGQCIATQSYCRRGNAQSAGWKWCHHTWCCLESKSADTIVIGKRRKPTQSIHSVLSSIK